LVDTLHEGLFLIPARELAHMGKKVIVPVRAFALVFLFGHGSFPGSLPQKD
jgi:hypothetical protein